MKFLVCRVSQNRSEVGVESDSPPCCCDLWQWPSTKWRDAFPNDDGQTYLWRWEKRSHHKVPRTHPSSPGIIGVPWHHSDAIWAYHWCEVSDWRSEEGSRTCGDPRMVPAPIQEQRPSGCMSTEESYRDAYNDDDDDYEFCVKVEKCWEQCVEGACSSCSASLPPVFRRNGEGNVSTRVCLCVCSHPVGWGVQYLLAWI